MQFKVYLLGRLLNRAGRIQLKFLIVFLFIFGIESLHTVYTID